MMLDESQNFCDKLSKLSTLFELSTLSQLSTFGFQVYSQIVKYGSQGALVKAWHSTAKLRITFNVAVEFVFSV